MATVNNSHHQDSNPNTPAGAAQAVTPAKQTVSSAKIVDTQSVLKRYTSEYFLDYSSVIV